MKNFIDKVKSNNVFYLLGILFILVLWNFENFLKKVFKLSKTFQYGE